MRYTEEHEWLRIEGDVVVVGITEHAAEQLGDVVFVELPEVEAVVAKGDEVCVIESVKAASDILAPRRWRDCRGERGTDRQSGPCERRSAGRCVVFQDEAG